MAASSLRSTVRKFDFTKWAQDADLHADIIDSLTNEGFLTLTALCNMTVDDISDLNLSKKGFVRCLEGAVRDLQTEYRKGPMFDAMLPIAMHPVTANNVNVGPTNLSAAGAVNDIDPDSTSTRPTSSAEHGKSVPLDDFLGIMKQPQESSAKLTRFRLQDVSSSGLGPSADVRDISPEVYLRKDTSQATPQAGTASSCLKIVDYIPGAARVQEMQLADGITLAFKHNRPKLESVSPSQWIVANSKIMSHLLESGSISSTQVMDYVAYTAKIGELACRYSWMSVMLFDNEYRELQAIHKFRWGADIPHLSTVCLRERSVTNVQNSKSGKAKSARTPSKSYVRKIAPSGKEICWKYNSGNCNFGTKCNFEHVCITCGNSHPECDHDKFQHQHVDKVSA